MGQTALQGDNDGLGAVSHIQAHQYYADVRLHISHETSEMWGHPAMGGGDRAQSAFMDNERQDLLVALVLLTDFPSCLRTCRSLLDCQRNAYRVLRPTCAVGGAHRYGVRARRSAGVGRCAVATTATSHDGKGEERPTTIPNGAPATRGSSVSSSLEQERDPQLRPGAMPPAGIQGLDGSLDGPTGPSGLSLAVAAAVVTVNVLETEEPPDGATLAGENEQVARLGSVPQENFTVPAYPP